jgi:hypothetical protein
MYCFGFNVFAIACFGSQKELLKKSTRYIKKINLGMPLMKKSVFS